MDAAASSPATRLNGWKEIAGYFGRAVRTVQRWERELGLPVHRLATGKGETVFALVAELDQWMADNERTACAGLDSEPVPPEEAASAPAPVSAERAPAAVRRPRRGAWWAVAGGLLLVVIAGVILAWAAGVGSGDRRIPSAYRRAGRVLTVLDQSGEVMWHRTMPFELYESHYATDPRMRVPVIFQDLDGDGRTEVLFKAIAAEAADSRLLVFEETGTLRFAWGYSGTKRFGDDAFPAPWTIGDAFVRTPAGRAPETWVVVFDVPWFPSALVRLDARGRMTGEFWNPGQITTVAAATVDGREVLLAGGAHNESKCGFLAVVDPEVSSTAPAERAYYTCRDCPSARPLRYLLFPRTAISRELDAQAFAREIRQDSSGRLFVVVEHLGFPAPGEVEILGAPVFYTLDQQLRPVAAEVSGDYPRTSRKLEVMGLLPRPFDQAEHERELWPVREWNGSAFVALPVPPK